MFMMAHSKTMLIILCVYFLLQACEAKACICDPKPNSTSICFADFGLRATVVGSETEGSTRVFEILPKLIYHLSDFPFETEEEREKHLKEGTHGNCHGRRVINRFDVDFFRVRTDTNETECGVALTPGKDYILTGKFDASFSGPPKRMRLDACDWFQEWDSLTDADIVFISYPDKCFGP